MNKNQGSQWRRWDLHVHTPFTKKEDRYLGKTDEEKWDNFYASIQNYIGNGNDPLHSICAIAITDYLSVDNYLKVSKDNRLPDSIKFILPNVELRMEPIATKSPINIHCLFSPEIAEELEYRFFSKLKVTYNNNVYGATKSDLIRLGRDFNGKTSISDDEAFKKGLSQYVITSDTLSTIFKNDSQLREKTIIAVSNSSTDGVSGLRTHSDYFEDNTSQLEAKRRAIYQLADMVFSANPKDIEYFLGKGVDAPEIVKEKCGSLKPCIHGSDAHCNEKIFAPDENRYCWIKADPTFEGLKQVIYEPEERVRISSMVPDSKSDYNVIDRIEILNNNDFSPEAIYLSYNLTCIIGGKSTGKSLLLHNIALAIDEEQVEKKKNTSSTNIRKIDGFKVYWRDGVCSDNKDKARKIVYIPQTYLNRLSDKEQETTEIDNIIQDIILQDEKCAKAFQQMNNRITNKKQAITSNIVKFLKLLSDKEVLEKQCKEIGDEDAIKSEIESLTSRFEQLSQTNNITEEEIKQYQTLVEAVDELNRKCSLINSDVANLKEIKEIIEVKYSDLHNIIVYKKIANDVLNDIKNSVNEMWLSKRDEIIEQANNDIENIKKQIENNMLLIEKYRPKIENNEQIANLSITLVNTKDKLNKLCTYKEQLQTLIDESESYLESLGNTFIEFSNIYLDYVNTINSNFISTPDELEFSVNKILREETFIKKIKEIVDNRSLNRFSQFNLNTITENVLSKENIIVFIKAILSKSPDSLQLKNDYNNESALREILTDWYNLDYVVRMDNDNIQDMSPGKKALVLLRLLISIAESSCPILIDQPEDDLDNRSIFSELIYFIKQKKIERQIIIVTHNANIVLGGDAELIIVANQDGKNAPNKEFRFEYRGGSIENNLPVTKDGQIESGILNSKGIQEHICEILEGGKHAFALRQHKYHSIKI